MGIAWVCLGMPRYSFSIALVSLGYARVLLGYLGIARVFEGYSLGIARVFLGYFLGMLGYCSVINLRFFY